MSLYTRALDPAALLLSIAFHVGFSEQSERDFALRTTYCTWSIHYLVNVNF